MSSIQVLIKKYAMFAAYSIMIVVFFHLFLGSGGLFITMVMLNGIKQSINKFNTSVNQEISHVCDLLHHDRRVLPSLPP